MLLSVLCSTNEIIHEHGGQYRPTVVTRKEVMSSAITNVSKDSSEMGKYCHNLVGG